MPERPRYMISVAADLVGMHPQTLRMYEAKGLVRPGRTPGGTRLYSDNDVERLLWRVALRSLQLANPHFPDGLPYAQNERDLQLAVFFMAVANLDQFPRVSHSANRDGGAMAA